jgi:hypothetical protein
MRERWHEAMIEFIPDFLSYLGSFAGPADYNPNEEQTTRMQNWESKMPSWSLGS